MKRIEHWRWRFCVAKSETRTIPKIRSSLSFTQILYNALRSQNSRETNRNIKRSVCCQHEWDSLKFRALAFRQRFSLWWMAYARTVRLYYPYWQYRYTDPFIKTKTPGAFFCTKCVFSIMLLQPATITSIIYNFQPWDLHSNTSSSIFDAKCLRLSFGNIASQLVQSSRCDGIMCPVWNWNSCETWNYNGDQ